MSVSTVLCAVHTYITHWATGRQCYLPDRLAFRLATLTIFGIAVNGTTTLSFGSPVALNTPTGLTAGQQFEIVFITDGTTAASSSDIATYNSFVSADANGATYNGTTVTWSAIASTTDESAMANIGSYNVPIYLVNGTEVAASSTANFNGLWYESLLAPINLDLTGAVINADIWTGTDVEGNPTSAPLGSAGGISNFGDSSAVDGAWVVGGVGGQFYSLALYGISEVLTVPGAAVPEPSTLVMAGAASSIGLLAWALRRHTHRRQGRHCD